MQHDSGQKTNTPHKGKRREFYLRKSIVRLSEAERVMRIEVRTAHGDNRRYCTECGNLDEEGYCLAAERKEIVASSKYQPVRDILRRCEAFLPMSGDPDQTLGSEKWGWLREYSKRNSK